MVYRQRRRIYGAKKISSIPYQKVKVIPSDPIVIAEMNGELREQCEEQRARDFEAKVWAQYLGCC